MDFVAVIEFLVSQFQQQKIDFAFIGGFGLQSAGVARSTVDIDMLVLAADAQKVKEIMRAKGYELLHESPEILNFLSQQPQWGRVDFLLAHRQYALTMLKRAKSVEAFGGLRTFKVAAPEDLIGLKVQAVANTPERRDKDMADIRQLLDLRRKTMDMNLVREYFQIFEMEAELDRILKEFPDAFHP